MALIIESRSFVVEAPERPLVDRNDGGHITITPKVRVVDIQRLTPGQATELIRLTMVVGEAMMKVMNDNGVDVGRINYQDNGNWGVFTTEGPYQHFHLYGRAISARYQKYGQACFFPHREEQPEFYASLQPLMQKDIIDMRNAIVSLLNTSKYSDETWKFPLLNVEPHEM